MRLTHLVGLSFVCMFSTSAGVWALTPADAVGAEGANVPLTVAAPEEEAQAVPLVSKPGTLSFEARLGHQQLPSGVANRSFVSVQVSAPDTAPGIAKQPLNLAIAIDRSGSMKGVRLTNAVNAARAIRRPELGTLKPGALGEASIFEVLDQPTEYRDVIGEVMQSNIAFKAHGLVLDGRWWT